MKYYAEKLDENGKVVESIEFSTSRKSVDFVWNRLREDYESFPVFCFEVTAENAIEDIQNMIDMLYDQWKQEPEAYAKNVKYIRHLATIAFDRTPGIYNLDDNLHPEIPAYSKNVVDYQFEGYSRLDGTSWEIVEKED